MNWDISHLVHKPGPVVAGMQIKLDVLMLWLRHQKHQPRIKELHDKVQRRVKWLRSRRECVCFAVTE